MKDELFKQFGTARASFPTGEPSTLPSLFAGEHTAGESNLPEQVSQATILAENKPRWHNIGPGDRSPLAGTTVPEADNEEM